MQDRDAMLMSDSIQNGQHEIFGNVKDLIGEANFETYRKAWLANFVSDKDVLAMKQNGFNVIKVPLHYNLFTLPIEDEPNEDEQTWKEEGFQLLDSLLEWSEEHGMYVILSMEAAPGGQGRDAILSDYDSTKPSLWEDDRNVRKALSLWKRIANRYKDNKIIAGYDLLSKTNWNFASIHEHGCHETTNAELKSFFTRAIAWIRSVGDTHMVFVQGNCWGTNHRGLWPMVDDANNVALAFKRYYVENSEEQIAPFLQLRDQYQVPLWMSDQGRNNHFWYQEAARLYDRYGFGFSQSGWKELESTTSGYSITPPNGYADLTNFWAHGDNKPTADIATKVLMELTENLEFDRLTKNHVVFEALVGVKGRSCEQTSPVAIRTTSVRLQAEDYCDMYGMEAEETADVGRGFNMGYIDAGDWLKYTVNMTAGTYDISYRVASLPGATSFEMLSNLGTSNYTSLGTVDVPSTAGWQVWTTISHEIEISYSGVQTLMIQALGKEWNINWFEIERVA